MGTHKQRDRSRQKRGRPTKILSDSNKLIDINLKEKNYSKVAELTVYSSFLDQNKEELATKLLSGILTYKKIINNNWDVNIDNSLKESISQSENIYKYELSNNKKQEINNLIRSVYFEYLNKRKGGNKNRTS